MHSEIREIWSEELKISDISETDDFFALGGHSMIMMQIQTRLRQKLQVDVPMDELFRHSTIGQLAEFLERKGPELAIQDHAAAG